MRIEFRVCIPVFLSTCTATKSNQKSLQQSQGPEIRHLLECHGQVPDLARVHDAAHDVVGVVDVVQDGVVGQGVGANPGIIRAV